MGGVVLAEDEVHQTVVVVDDGEAVELVVPDDVVGFLQGSGLGSGDQLLTGGHEGGDLVIGVHTGDAVVAAGDDAQQLAVGGAVGGDGHGGEAVAVLQSQHVGQGVVGGQVGSGGDEAGLVALDTGDHSGLILDGLGAVDEADAALLGQSDGQGVIGDGLHDGRGHGDVQGQGRLLDALAVLDQGGAQGDVGRDALLGSVTGDQQVLAEGAAGLVEEVGHWTVPP